jgi:two-component system KDP operon response regulator KdpE
MSESGPRIVIIDDERAIRRFLRTVLEARDYQVYEAASGEDGLVTVAQHRPDIVILDLGLPGIDGIEVTQRLREWSEIPIIILSVREQEQDKIAALDAGADDYLTKPFGAGELMARLRAALRRITRPGTEPIFTVKDLTVDLTRRLVRRSGEEIQLTPTEYDLLRVLVSNAGKVVTHQQLLHQVWGDAYRGEFHLLRVNVSNLRHKLEPEPSRPRYIVTEPGIGYRMRDEE